MNRLIDILKMDEIELKNYLYDYLLEKNMQPIYENGFLYAKGNIPILLVAHMDTFFSILPNEIVYDEKNDMIYSDNGALGGDDRCGVYAIMNILEKYKPHVLFTDDEEIGGLGAREAVRKIEKPDVKYIIEFDRKGSNDCVFYDCDNSRFIKYIQSFGFKLDFGSFSDICILSDAWKIASVNLSSGYYNEHTFNEYIKFNELTNNINRVKHMLDNVNRVKYFKYREITLNNNTFDVYEDKFLELLNMYIKQFDSTGYVKKLTFEDNENNFRGDR